MKARFALPGAILVSYLLLMGSCQDEEQTGRIVVKITDAPFPITWIEEATVTITKIEIRAASAEEENAEGSSDGESADGEESGYIVLFDDPDNPFKPVLTDLSNGVTEELASQEIPANEYNLIRIYVSEATVKLFGVEEEVPVNVPSGEQTGVKVFIKPAIKLGGGETAEVLLDFSLDKSFVPLGSYVFPEDIEGFNFKPVIRAVNIYQTGMIKGFILSDTEPLANALVYVQEEGQQISTLTEEDGSYAILGISAGAYPITAEKEGYNSSTCAEVQVLAGKVTEKDFVLGKLFESTE